MMTYDLSDKGDLAGPGIGPSAYRRTHFRVYDENGFVEGFDTEGPRNFTLDRVIV